MKPKNFFTQDLFYKLFFKTKILKNCFLKSPSKKIFNSFLIKKLISIFPKIHLHFLSLFGQILFLAIILLFLFLLSVYFSQINFSKNHSNHYKINNLNLHFFDKINNNNFIFDKCHLNASCKALKLASKIKIDYG